MDNRKKRWLIGWMIVSFGLFALLALVIKPPIFLSIDVPITLAVQQWRSPWLDVVMDMAGQAGLPPQTLVLNGLIVLIVYICRLKPEALTILIFISLTGTLQMLLRYGIDRPRPDPALVFVMHKLENRQFSFPSGHTVNFIYAGGFLM